MKKVGFIGEGESEVVLLTSSSFSELLVEYDLESVGEIDAMGRGNLENYSEKLDSKLKILVERKAEKIFIISDLEQEPCINHYKQKITNTYNSSIPQVEIISVKAIEAWILADSVTMEKLLRGRFYFDQPESTINLPISELQNIFLYRTGRGLGSSKPRIMKKFIKNGFNLDKAAEHTNCDSAKYFVRKLKEVSEA